MSDQDSAPDKIALLISFYKEMEGDKLFQLPSLSQMIIHFFLEFKSVKNTR